MAAEDFTATTPEGSASEVIVHNTEHERIERKLSVFKLALMGLIQKLDEDDEIDKFDIYCLSDLYEALHVDIQQVFYKSEAA